MPSSHKFFVALSMDDGEFAGHSAAPDLESLRQIIESKSERDEQAKETKITRDKVDSFDTVFNSLVSVLNSYRRFLPLTLELAPQIVEALAERFVASWVRANGSRRVDVSCANTEVFELNTSLSGEFFRRHEQVTNSMEGAKALPEVMIIGLVSAYDAFLSSLLRVVISKHQEIVLTSEKQLTFKQLLEFGSIENARAILIEREIESVIRKSHDEQFDWMERHLDVVLRRGLSIWPRFIELCERRNLFTHTGGVVSAQYINNCRNHKCDVGGVNVDDRLVIDQKYFQAAVEVVAEIAIKLCYVFWRKFDEGEAEIADSKYNEYCMGLISGRSYTLAEALLSFGCKVPRLRDEIRRMMVVNLANAIRLQGRHEEAKRLLNSEDWSASNDKFKICIASVGGKIEEVLEMMDALGRRISATEYRDWPVFRNTRDDPRFVETFEKIFKEPYLLAPASSTVRQLDNDEGVGNT
jgi:hypothetical protein